MKKIIPALAATLLLAGCGSGALQRPVAEPTAGEKARVRVLYGSGGAMTASPNSDCYAAAAEGTGVVVGYFIGTDDGYRNRTIGIPAGREVPNSWRVAEFYVAAGKPITFAMRTGHAIPFCRFTQQFSPEPNKDYEMYAWVNSNERVCGAELRSLTDNSVVLMEKAPLCK